MFKQLLLAVLILMFSVSISLMLPLSVAAFEDGQQCTLIEGGIVIQIMPDQSLRGVINPEDILVDIGPEITVDNVTILTRATKDNDWQGAHMGMVMVDLGAGPFPCMIVVRPQYVKDCK